MQNPPRRAAGDTRPVVHLSLDDAVKAALDRNLDIAVQRLNPEITDIAYASISVGLPSEPDVAHWPAVDDDSPDQPDSPQRRWERRHEHLDLTINGGVAQNIPWGGGAQQVAVNNSRQHDDQQLAVQPVFQSTWTVSYVQPLLRNFRIDATRQQLLVTKLSRDISDVQLRATITNTLSNVRNAYWDYVFAVQSVDVAQQSVDLANQLVKDNQTRVEVGTMAPIDVVQAQSQAATQQQNLVTAQGAMRTAELALKRLIVAGTQDPNWNVQLDPTDRPEFVPSRSISKRRCAGPSANGPTSRLPRRRSRRTT